MTVDFETLSVASQPAPVTDANAKKPSSALNSLKRAIVKIDRETALAVVAMATTTGLMITALYKYAEQEPMAAQPAGTCEPRLPSLPSFPTANNTCPAPRNFAFHTLPANATRTPETAAPHETSLLWSIVCPIFNTLIPPVGRLLGC